PRGIQVALMFLFFHKRLCGPLANSRFHHQPDPAHRPESKLEVAYHRADRAIQDIVNLLAAAAFWPKPWEVRTIRTLGSSTPTSTPVIHRPSCGSKPRRLWRRIVGIDRCSTSIMFWNRITGPSNAGCAQANIFVHSG